MTEVPGIYPRAEVAKGRHAQIRTLVQRDRWLRLVKDSSVLDLKIFLALLGKNATEHQFTSFALSVIAPNVVSKELLDSAKELEKLTEL